LYWSSLLVSAIGVANVTIAWQVYEITRSPLRLGLTGLFRGLPILIFSLGGWLEPAGERREAPLLLVRHYLFRSLAVRGCC